MANTYYDSQLTAAEIEAVLEAINGILTPANNGKVLAINNGKIEARSVQWGGGSTLEPLNVTANGNYYPEVGVDGFDEVHVSVPNSYSASDEGKVVSNGALVAQTARASQITQNGTYDTTLNNEVTVNVSGSSAVVHPLNVTQNGTYNPPSGVDGYAPIVVSVSGGGGNVAAFAKVAFTPGDIIEATDGSTTLLSDTSGNFVFELPNIGTWTFTNTTSHLSETVVISYADSVNVAIISLDESKYIRGNYSGAYFVLNWINSYDDLYEFVFKNFNSPGAQGNWPKILSKGATNDDYANCIYHQYNFYGGRKTINVGNYGTWAGDGNISYESPFDYSNYYKLTKESQSMFRIYKSADLVNWTMLTERQVSPQTSVGQNDPINLWNPSKGAMDMAVYGLNVFNSRSECTHMYLPYKDGLYDVISRVFIPVTGTGYINGPDNPEYSI